MCRGTVYIDTIPEVRLDATGATLEYTSGGETYRRRYPRALWRRFLEGEIRRLNEYEARERCEVLRLERGESGAH